WANQPGRNSLPVRPVGAQMPPKCLLVPLHDMVAVCSVAVRKDPAQLLVLRSGAVRKHPLC
ncbi:MAG: hypothetical protein JWR26_4085, partial [Pedosphaera sp.]|nr:hypothetical protein [Pedosphaera sp.]